MKSEDAIVDQRARRAAGAARSDQAAHLHGQRCLSGGLGFGLGAALGAKLAAPEREVIVTVGDGSYMFGNPVPYHYRRPRREPADPHHRRQQPDRGCAVRQSTLDVYPDGDAAKANVMPLTELKPSPDYEKVVEICGGHGEKVEGPTELLPALERGARSGARRHAGDCST